MTKTAVTCSNCGCSFGTQTVPETCPDCGSTKRITHVAIFAEDHAYASEGWKVSSSTEKHKKRFFIEGFDGWEWSERFGRLVRKVNIFDRRNDRRYEHVEDAETGGVIHHHDGKLSEHKGHGSGKTRRRDSDKD